ncbi:MAG: diadenosine tetraphosphate hydrolase [Candidatus Aenigmarchaeota archaeon ex4484_224]|nr:MAG: diadenosine tetraphosphate hydrolase [Candidatus Aenigmarchaeota archaeon ex4484_224]
MGNVNGNNMKKDCIFCKIVNGEIDSAKIWEDNEFLAILDINPNMKGMTLLITKKHYDSYVFDMPKDVYQRFLLAARKVAKILEKGLNVKRVAMVMEGLGINHAHIKLYPLHGLKEKFEEKWSKERVFFKEYPGYLTTQLGPRVNLEELKKLAKEIRKKSRI